MRITFQSQGNIQNVMRQCGYFFIREEKGELAFVRPLSSAGSGYPRFHAYVNMEKFPRETSLNLHLDQKKPIYRATGVAAHSGEYEGEIVEKEAARIKEILGPMVQR